MPSTAYPPALERYLFVPFAVADFIHIAIRLIRAAFFDRLTYTAIGFFASTQWVTTTALTVLQMAMVRVVIVLHGATLQLSIDFGEDQDGQNRDSKESHERGDQFEEV